MTRVTFLSSCYRLISELLLYPEDRDSSRIEGELSRIKLFPSSIQKSIQKFVSEPASHSPEDYIKTVEFSASYAFYLGAHLFEEPKSCCGAGLSGRNSYMITLANLYKHFGYELNGRELPDFLPVMVDFLWLSLDRMERDRIGLRRYFLEQCVLPGIKPLLAALKKSKSPYALLVECLDTALKEDIVLMKDQPVWEPPDEASSPQNQTMTVYHQSRRKGGGR